MFTNSNSCVDTFVDLLVFVVDNRVSDHDVGLGRVPTYIIKFISINLLQTLQQVQQSLKVDVDVDQLVKNLTDMINFHLHTSEGWREVYPLVKHQSCEIDFQNMWIKRRKLAEASANSSTSSENHRSLIYEYSTKITQMLMEMVVTYQPSPDSLYSHVNKAVLVLHAVACNAPCLIMGELINVAGADDEIVKEQYETADLRDMFEGASDCLYNLGGATSYMISTLQCLGWVPELKSALFEWHPLFEISKDHLLTAAMRDLFKEIDKNAGPVEPRKFLQMAFGKKRTVEERDREEEDFSSRNMNARKPDVEILDDEDESAGEEESNTQNSGGLSRASRSTTQSHHSQTQMQQSKPLYDEVILTGVAPGKNPGGSKSWICKHCHTQYSSSYTRIHAHFFGGSVAGKKTNITRCPTMLTNRSELERIRKIVQEAEKVGVCSSLKSSKLIKRHNPVENVIKGSFKAMERDEVDLMVIRGLCANGISFNVLRNPQFHEMVSAINNGPKGYKAPSFEKARTTLLDKCKTNVERDLIPVKETWYTHGVTIVSDGWTNVKHQQLINIIAVNSCGAMFLYAEDFTGTEKTGRVIADFLLKAIEEVGPENVLQVVTDNAANCKLAGKEVEKVHTHIFWSPYVVHTLNLIFKDFAKKFDWFRDTYQSGKTIVKYFLNHTHALAMFRAQSKLELLKVAKTRFASHYILLKRLADCREALATTVVLKNWKDWVKSGDEHIRTLGYLVADTIKSEDFWDDVNHIITITKPLYFLIKFCDGEGPKMGEIYEKMDNMMGEIEDVMRDGKHADKYPQIKEILLARWEKMNIPMHSLGFALSPRFYDSKYLATPAPGGLRRRRPNEDKEVIKGVFEAFDKITDNQQEAQQLRKQFIEFHSRKGLFAMPSAHLDATIVDAIDWWSTYGSQTPELADVAKKLFRERYPKSSQLDNDYNPKDAQTCWIQLLDSLSQSLKSPGVSSENIDIVKDLFDIRLVRSGNKNPEEKSVGMLKWRVSREVDHLHEGLRYFLDFKIGGGSFLIDGLPRYLTIRFLRGQGRANRKINLLEVDVYDLCSDELRVKLEPARKMASLKVSEKSSGFKMSDAEGSSDGSGDKYKATCRRGQQETQLTGFYDLVAMVSHSNHKPHEGIVGQGYYTNFMKYRGADRTGPGLWIMYMDDKRNLIRKPHFVEQIMRGGDGLAPYICLYKARVALVN